jgi:hypothetical protein
MLRIKTGQTPPNGPERWNQPGVFEPDASSRDGFVYLCLGGREYWCNTKKGPDFGMGITTDFVFGTPTGGISMWNPTFNDPNKFYPLTAATLALPVWIRFEEGVHSQRWWLMKATATVRVNGVIQAVFEFKEKNGIWLGPDTGKFCFLRRSPLKVKSF